MSSRPRTRSASMGSSGDESDTPSMTGGLRSTRSKRTTLETVIASPEPTSPIKKLSFTAAKTPRNPGGGATPTSGVRSKEAKGGPAASVTKVPPSISEEQPGPARRSTNKGQGAAEDDNLAREEALTTATPKSRVPKSDRKKSERKGGNPISNGAEEQGSSLTADVAKAQSEIKSAKKSAKKAAPAAVSVADKPSPPEAAVQPLESSARKEKSAKKSAKKKQTENVHASPVAAIAPVAGIAVTDEKAAPSAVGDSAVAKSARKSAKRAKKLKEEGLDATEHAAASPTPSTTTTASTAMVASSLFKRKRKTRRGGEIARRQRREETTDDSNNGQSSSPASSFSSTKDWKLRVHRCRFVGWMPDPIHALAAPPPSLPPLFSSSPASSAPAANRVAVARAGGCIELVNVDERWSVEARVEGRQTTTAVATAAASSKGVGSEDGSKSSSGVSGLPQEGGDDVRAMVWVGGGGGGAASSPPRLVGATLGGSLFVADFRKGVRSLERDSLGGTVWALATPPPCRRQQGGGGSSLVAAACEDGTVRIFRLVASSSSTATTSVRTAAGDDDSDKDSSDDEGGGVEAVVKRASKLDGEDSDDGESDEGEGDDDEDPLSRGLEFVRTLGPVGARITSLAWGPAAGSSPHNKPAKSEDAQGEFLSCGPLYAGTADGTIHRFDVSGSGQGATRKSERMTLERRGTQSGSGTAAAAGVGDGVGDGGGGNSGEAVVVWALLALRDGTLVSGDSGGCVRFWDGPSASHVLRVETHAADVLCLASSTNELSVFASGIDHKVVCLNRLQPLLEEPFNNGVAYNGGAAAVEAAGSEGGVGSGGNPADGVWSLCHAYRAHQLDVRALAVVQLSKHDQPEHNAAAFNKQRNGSSGGSRGGGPGGGAGGALSAPLREVLVSGGLDTKLCTYHVKNFTEHRPKRIWPFPYHSVISLAPQPRLLLAQHRDKLCLWKLPPNPNNNNHKQQPATTSSGEEVGGGQVPASTATSGKPTGVGDEDGNSLLPAAGGDGHTLLLELKLKLHGAVVACSAVSPRGDFIAVSDNANNSSASSSGGDGGLRLFTLKPRGGGGGVKVVKCRLSSAVAKAVGTCQRLLFTSAGQRLVCATQRGHVVILRVPTTTSATAEKDQRPPVFEVEHSFNFCADVRRATRSANALSSSAAASGVGQGQGAWLLAGGLPFSALAASTDGQWLAVSGGNDNSTLVYSMDSMALWWAPPRPNSRITALAFHPTPPASAASKAASSATSGANGASGGAGRGCVLAVACVDNRFHLYEVEARRLADWSVDNADRFPTQLRHRADAIVGAAFSPTAPIPDSTALVAASGKKKGKDGAAAAAPAAAGGEGGGGGGELLLRSHGFLCFVDLGAPPPTNARIHPPTHLAAKNDLARRQRQAHQRLSRQKLQLAQQDLCMQPSASSALTAAQLVPSASALSKRPRSNSVSSDRSTGSAHELQQSILNSAVKLASTAAPGSLTPGKRGGGGGGDCSGNESDADDGVENRNFAITLQYRPVIFADFLGPRELVVVEEPWLKIMQRLPDPIFRQRFGT